MKTRLLGLTAGTAAIMIAIASPAFAGDFQKGRAGSTAKWFDSPNIFQVIDVAGDARLAAGQLRKPNGDIVTITVTTDGATVQQTVNLQEDKSIALRACYNSGVSADGNVYILESTCTDWEYGLS